MMCLTFFAFNYEEKGLNYFNPFSSIHPQMHTLITILVYHTSKKNARKKYCNFHQKNQLFFNEYSQNI